MDGAGRRTDAGGPGLPRALWAILALALAIRVASVVATPDYSPLFDSGDYVRHAESIAAGDGFPESVLAADGGPSAFRPPLYPYLLGGIYALTGDDAGETAGRLAGALLGTLDVWLIFLVGSRIWGATVGIVAAALAAVLPPIALLNMALITEPLFIALMLGMVLAALESRDREGDWRFAALAGVACGLAALTRSNGILLVIPAALGVWVVRPRFSLAALGLPAAVLGAAAITVAPWTIRNTIEFDHLVPISTQSGFGLSGAFSDEARNYPGYPATWYPPQQSPRYADVFESRGVDEAELDRELRGRATSYAEAHPTYVLELIARNTLRTFDLLGVEPVSKTADRLQQGLGEDAGRLVRLSTYLLDLLALAGIVALALRPARRRGPLFIWLIPVLMVLAAVWLIASTRYRAPAYPFMILLAAIALVDLRERYRARARQTSERPADGRSRSSSARQAGNAAS